MKRPEEKWSRMLPRDLQVLVSTGCALHVTAVAGRRGRVGRQKPFVQVQLKNQNGAKTPSTMVTLHLQVTLDSNPEKSYQKFLSKHISKSN